MPDAPFDFVDAPAVDLTRHIPHTHDLANEQNSDLAIEQKQLQVNRMHRQLIITNTLGKTQLQLQIFGNINRQCRTDPAL